MRHSAWRGTGAGTEVTYSLINAPNVGRLEHLGQTLSLEPMKDHLQVMNNRGG
jgi:hypothetical protein